jgi:Ca-activated chloride channel homolog
MTTFFVILSLLTGASDLAVSPTCETIYSTAPRPIASRPAAPRPAIVTLGTLPRSNAELGTISGVVTDAGSGRLLMSAQVFLPGLNKGGLTDRQGRFLILDVPVGEHLVRVELIGYASAEFTLTSTSGQTTTAAVQLTGTALNLQELLVTGVAASRPRTRVAVASDRSTVSGAETARRAVSAASSSIMLRGPTRLQTAQVDASSVGSRSAGTQQNREGYEELAENPFLPVATRPQSTFSIDVDRASYANIRRFLCDGMLPPESAVRIEEMINYFDYDYSKEAQAHPFSVSVESGPAPWRPEHQLVRIGIQGRSVSLEEMPPSNLVFLIDVSGSMNAPDKLPLLKAAFGLLVDQLRPQDRVAIVVYAGAAGVVLPSTPGDQKTAIRDALERLRSGGSTAGGAGLMLAYDVAKQSFIEGGNNRVLLATDGDFNVGESSDGAMVQLIEAKRDEGTFLSVLGFGTGNLQDAKMEKIADHGNGNFAYIDGISEARKVLVEEMGGTLLAIAKDVKLQVEFNPTRVKGYRLIGYENRMLEAEDFDDDTKDAGELGAGHSVTALYEVVPLGVDTDVEFHAPAELRYQRGPELELDPAAASDELLFVKVRYKLPDGEESHLIQRAVRHRTGRLSEDFRFTAAVASFGMLLRGSRYAGSASFERVLRWAGTALGVDTGGYRAEFVDMVRRAVRIRNAEDALDLKEEGEK